MSYQTILKIKHFILNIIQDWLFSTV